MAASLRQLTYLLVNSESVLDSYTATRAASLAYCAPLQPEDYLLQAAIFASPPKWHLAHTSWFFETFLLKPYLASYETPDPIYEVLFNSYYNGIGEQHPRDRRGLLSRPTLDQVRRYREHIDRGIAQLLQRDHEESARIQALITLGIEHERQHQELFFTDIKYSLAANPMLPAYLQNGETHDQAACGGTGWTAYEGGLVSVGFAGEGFAFDNESPRHRRFLEPFALANRLVTNAEYQAFIDDGGYRRPELWLADGWAQVCAEGWQHPLHWHDRDGQAMEYTLHGLCPRRPDSPVCHVSGYEAEAYARWANARLPLEAEWEHAIAGRHGDPNGGVLNGRYHPRPALGTEPAQFYGECWQWTRSAYEPYPGYAPGPGAIGEYNGKFMSNQWVLRGGSCVTHPSQARPTYRNFFYPQDRWQFSGIRLARQE